MERLIELLNKYAEEKGMKLRWAGGDWWLEIWDYGEALSEAVLVSKNYGFINWLIENRYVDLNKIPIRFEYYMQWNKAPFYVDDDTNILLMELAITAFPVDLLVNLVD